MRTAQAGEAGVRDVGSRELKFRSLAESLRRGILAGTWPAGSKLPTEHELVASTGLSLTTVRRAFDELVRQDLVTRRQGAGSFVAPRPRRALHIRRSVGVLLPDTQSYYPPVLQGIEEALSGASASLQLATYRYDPEAEDRTIGALLDSGVDGMLLVPTLAGLDDPAGRAASLMRLRVPVVLLERHLLESGPADRTEHVCSDHSGGAYDAVEHLAMHGHTRIALLTRTIAPTGGGVAVGYRHAVRDLHLAEGLEFGATKAEWENGGAQAAATALERLDATAALVFGDREATLLEHALLASGRSVPADVALISYDDEMADVAQIPLTAVSPPKFQIGKMAAQVLLRRLAEGDDCPLHQVKLRPRIVIRASCGPHDERTKEQ